MKKAFTLIELLVVIAIIAILAAILFPVFAQAKLAAKKTSELSNVKQMELATIIYTNDFDDTFPVSDFWGNGTAWPQRVLPYVKSAQMFDSPVDGPFPCTATTWCNGFLGPGISLAGNALHDSEVPTNNGGPNQYLNRGVFGVFNGTWSQFNGAVATAVTNPAATIALAEKDNKELAGFPCSAGNPWQCLVNSKGPTVGSLFMQDSLLKIPTGQDWATEWAAYIPDAARSNGDATVAYPYGTRGGVANPYSGQSIFAFVDGHAKSLRPEATNPNGDLQPQNNMWDATR